MAKIINMEIDMNFLNRNDYYTFYNHNMVAFITNVLIPYMYQFENLHIIDYYKRLILHLIESGCSYEDIYFSIGCYLLTIKEEIENDMNIVRRILFATQQTDLEEVKQLLLFIQPIIEIDVGNENGNISNLEDVKVTVSKEELDKIPLIDFSELEKKDTICSICLDEFEKEHKIRKTVCGHLFHMKCLDKWLSENSYKCPMCRAEITSPSTIIL